MQRSKIKCQVINGQSRQVLRIQKCKKDSWGVMQRGHHTRKKAMKIPTKKAKSYQDHENMPQLTELEHGRALCIHKGYVNALLNRNVATR